MKNVDFAPVLVFPIRKLFFGSQDGLQNALRSSQEGSKRVLRSIFFRHRFDFGPILVPFWLPLGSLLGAQNDPKIDPKIYQKSSCCKMASKTAPRPPKGLPRCSPDSPRPPQDPPRPSQNAPESLPGPSWTIQKIKNFEIVENLSNKRSTMVAHNGHSIPSLERIESQFTTVEPPRVAAVVARSALQ